MVFQEFDQLLPWKTVRDNVTFALINSGRFSKAEAGEQARHFIAKVDWQALPTPIPTHFQAHETACGHCPLPGHEPEIILMDEPFASLDELTRQHMQEELLALWAEARFTMIFVTHSIDEAITWGRGFCCSRLIRVRSRPSWTWKRIYCGRC